MLAHPIRLVWGSIRAVVGGPECFPILTLAQRGVAIVRLTGTCSRRSYETNLR